MRHFIPSSQPSALLISEFSKSAFNCLLGSRFMNLHGGESAVSGIHNVVSMERRCYSISEKGTNRHQGGLSIATTEDKSSTFMWNQEEEQQRSGGEGGGGAWDQRSPGNRSGRDATGWEDEKGGGTGGTTLGGARSWKGGRAGEGRCLTRGRGKGEWTQDYPVARRVTGKDFNRVSRSRPESEQHRYWCSAAKELPSHDKFVLASYNILADKYAAHHWNELYYHIPWGLMHWHRRKVKIVRELGLWSPDIMCLQEVDMFEDLQKDFQKRGYSGSYEARTGGACDGCAIFWRTTRFQLLQEESIRFNELGLRDNVAQLCVFQSLAEDEQNDNNIGAGIDTRINSGSKSGPGSVVIVGNIHVLFNPKRGDIKLGQVRILLEAAHALSTKWGGAPVAIAGDFNSTPGSDIYRFLATSKLDISNLNRSTMSGQVEAGEVGPLACQSQVEQGSFLGRRSGSVFSDHLDGRYDPAGLTVNITSTLQTSEKDVTGLCPPPMDMAPVESNERADSPKKFNKGWIWTTEERIAATGTSDCTMLRHNLNLRSAYSQIKGEVGCRGSQGEPLVTTYHRKFMGTVDYIWHTEGIDTVKVLDTLPVSVLQCLQGLPSQKWGSDHLALACELALL